MLKLQVIGNLGADARVEEINGKTGIFFNVADTYKYTDNTGEKRERTTWVSCAIYPKNGSIKIAEYLKKGTKVFVEGRLSVKTYTDSNGQTQAAVNMVVTHTELLGAKSDSENATQNANAQPEPQTTQTAEVEDDLPF